MVYFVIGEDKVFVSDDKFHAEGIKGIMQAANDKDLEIVVDKKYHNTIGNYIDFLHDNFNTIITTAENLLACST